MAGAIKRLPWLLVLAPLAPFSSCSTHDDLVADRIPTPSSGGGELDGGASSGGASSGGASSGGDQASGGDTATDGGSAGATGSGGGQAGSANDCAPDRATISVPLANGIRGRRCSAWAARRSFSHAVCSCGDLSVFGALLTDAYDSSLPRAGSGRGGAAVGVNGAYSGAQYIHIDGSFTVGSATALNSPGGLDIAGDLRLAGPTTAAGSILVSRDAWLQGDISTFSIFSVGRDLHLSKGTETHAILAVGGDTIANSPAFSPPCACGSEDTLDIAGVVSDTLGDNDNALIDLQLGELSEVATRTELTLRCGRFALRGLSGRTAITIHVSGHVSLVVEGDALIPRGFSVVLEPQAELDWFISGNLTLSADTRIGDAQRASAVRVYVLGSKGIDLPGNDQLGMNLYAPRAKVTVESLGNVYGAVFASAVSSRGLLFAHYDRAVLLADEACTAEPQPACTSCDQCDTTSTCVAGACTACTKDADCCFPLTCQQGQCQALIAN